MTYVYKNGKTFLENSKKSLSRKEVTPESLGVMIQLIEADKRNINSYEELKECINKEFKVNVTLDEIINHYMTIIDQEDRKLILTHAELLW